MYWDESVTRDWIWSTLVEKNVTINLVAYQFDVIPVYIHKCGANRFHFPSITGNNLGGKQRSRPRFELNYFEFKHSNPDEKINYNYILRIRSRICMMMELCVVLLAIA